METSAFHLLLWENFELSWNPFQFYLTIWVKGYHTIKLPCCSSKPHSLYERGLSWLLPVLPCSFSADFSPKVPNMLHTVVTVEDFLLGEVMCILLPTLSCPQGWSKRVNTSHGRSIGLLPRHWNIKPFFLLQLLE